MTWVLVGVIVVLLIIVAVFAVREQRTRQLRREFGPEYDRVVAERDGQQAGERELRERRERIDSFEIRDLDPAAQRRYAQRWHATQRRFVDEPEAAVGEAHLLVQEVMRERGYPVEGDFEQRAADISVDHADVVDNYREAHAISVRAQDGGASTEQLRQSMVHFRALFDELLGPEDARPDPHDQRSVAEPTNRSR
ncbi:MAG: hypothetical protein JOZ07_02475 [Solirubrobacterales bacterium]|nr:hypothetical protein [Solirubrobacterales bacterium]